MVLTAFLKGFEIYLRKMLHRSYYWCPYYREKGLCAKSHGMLFFSLKNKIKKNASAHLLTIKHTTVLRFCIIGHF